MRILVATVAAFVVVASSASVAASEYEVGDRLVPGETAGETPEIQWDDLIPADWDPLAAFEGLNLYELEDSDPRAIEALEKVREAWEAAPANETMAGKTGRIAGFLVPLDWNSRELSEFLLVPYFGACIHTPPPPANQIIHVKADPPVRDLQVMEAVWVEGQLEIVNTDTDMGRSGYRMQARSVELYVW